MGRCRSCIRRLAASRQHCHPTLLKLANCDICIGYGKLLRIGCSRTYLIALNLAFLIGGSTAVGLGFWMRLERQTIIQLKLVHNFPTSGPLVLFEKLPSIFVIVGGSVAILSFLGCCGACTESACFLSLYTLLLCLVLITEVVLTFIVSVNHNKILLKFQNSLQYQIRHEYNKTGKYFGEGATTDYEFTTDILDLVQIKMKCCGSSGPKDYQNSAWFNQTQTRLDGDYVPPSCCIANSTIEDDDDDDDASLHQRQHPLMHLRFIPRDHNKCQIEAILLFNRGNLETINSLKTVGCHRAIVNWFNVNSFKTFLVVLCCIAIQIIDLLSACFLLTRLRKNQTECDVGNESEIG